jgi:hypothetical protein
MKIIISLEFEEALSKLSRPVGKIKTGEGYG